MKHAFAQIVFFLVAATMLGAGRNIVAPGGIAWVGDWAERDSVVAEVLADPHALPPSAEEGDPPFLSLEEAAAKFDDPNVIFVDAREPEEYDAGHIAGAVLLPFDWFDEYWPIAREKLPFGREIVTYCSGAECELSLFLARHLRNLGYHNISIFYGGWRLWKQSGRPVAKAPPTS